MTGLFNGATLVKTATVLRRKEIGQPLRIVDAKAGDEAGDG